MLLALSLFGLFILDILENRRSLIPGRCRFGDSTLRIGPFNGCLDCCTRNRGHGRWRVCNFKPNSTYQTVLWNFLVL